MTDEELETVYEDSFKAAFMASPSSVTAFLAALRAVFLAGARAALEEVDHNEIERYEGKDGRRQWGRHTTTWLYPGDRVWVVNFGGQRVAPLVGGEK